MNRDQARTILRGLHVGRGDVAARTAAIDVVLELLDEQSTTVEVTSGPPAMPGLVDELNKAWADLTPDQKKARAQTMADEHWPRA